MLTSSLQLLPTIRIFPELSFDVDDATSNDPCAPSVSSTNSALIPPSVIHIISHQGSGNLTVKVFRLIELPTGSLERALTALDLPTIRAVKYARSIRAVRWDTAKRDYVFNARLGEAIDASRVPILELLRTARFDSIEDQRAQASPTTHDDANNVQHFRFIGQVPTVQQFLAGMGETALVDPNEPPQMPEDSERFLARPEYGPSSTAGRARVPRARSQSVTSTSDEDDDKDDEDDDDDDSTVTPINVFANLLTATAPPNRRAELDHGADSNGDNHPTTEHPITFAGLLQRPGNANIGQEQTSSPSTTSEQVSGITIPTRPVDRSTPPTSDGLQGQTAQDSNTIPAHTRSYAAVDKMGLTVVASLQAEWENENNAQQTKEPSRSGIRLRLALQNSAAHPQLQTGSDSGTQSGNMPAPHNDQLDRSSASRLNSEQGTSPGSRYRRASRSGLWATTPPPVWVSEGQLVDAETPAQATAHAATPPPGYLHNIQEELINDADAADVPTVDVTADHGGPIVERLQPPLEPVRLFNTMRQQKAKKGSGSSSTRQPKASGSNRVVLPMPEPPPAPRPNKTKSSSGDEPTSHRSLTTTAIDAAHNTHTTGGTSETTTNLAATTASAKATTINKTFESTGSLDNQLNIFVRQLASSQDLSGAQVKVQFGTILLRHPKDDNFLKGANEATWVEQKLREAGDAIRTEFLPRLTTSMDDAQHLLTSIPGSDITAQVCYEIHFKTSNGKVRVVRIDQTHREFQIVATDAKLGTAYIHYPIHVWDAEVVVHKPTTDDTLIELCGKLVASMQTIGIAPSFQAFVQPGSPSVHKVYAKRIFSKTTTKRAIAMVTEVQDLSVQAISMGGYNLQAVALPTQEMVKVQRLWWQCSLTLDDVTPASAGILQEEVDGIISRIDGVGFGNVGPWEKIPSSPKKPSPKKSRW